MDAAAPPPLAHLHSRVHALVAVVVAAQLAPGGPLADYATAGGPELAQCLTRSLSLLHTLTGDFDAAGGAAVGVAPCLALLACPEAPDLQGGGDRDRDPDEGPLWALAATAAAAAAVAGLSVTAVAAAAEAHAGAAAPPSDLLRSVAAAVVPAAFAAAGVRPGVLLFLWDQCCGAGWSLEAVAAAVAALAVAAAATATATVGPAGEGLPGSVSGSPGPCLARVSLRSVRGAFQALARDPR